MKRPPPWTRDSRFLRFLCALLIGVALLEAGVIAAQQRRMDRNALVEADLRALDAVGSADRIALLLVTEQELPFRLSDVHGLQGRMDSWLEGFAGRHGLEQRTHDQLRAALAAHAVSFGQHRVELATGIISAQDEAKLQLICNGVLHRTVEQLVEPTLAAAFLADFDALWPGWVEEQLGQVR